MRLFFETTGQASRFLVMAPLGFVLALCLDADAATGRLRLFFDCVLLLACGMAALCTLSGLLESGLRGYHLLGLLTGAVLYTQGAGRIIHLIGRKIRRRQEKPDGAQNTYSQ